MATTRYLGRATYDVTGSNLPKGPQLTSAEMLRLHPVPNGSRPMQGADMNAPRRTGGNLVTRVTGSLAS